MDRETWLREKRRETVERYDRLFAPTYDEQWGAVYPTHVRFVERFLSHCPPGATILDAACGTGKYWPTILAGGRAVVGADQSAAMLARARAKFPDVRTERMGLQELAFQEAFEGAICVDAMEFVCPEEWPLVLGNLRRAIRGAGYLYFTVEVAAEEEIERAFAISRELGLPAVYGEWAHEAGYHYYPAMKQIKEWVREAGLALLEDAFGDDYQHFLCRRAE